MKALFATALCAAALMSQARPASAEAYGFASMYYSYGSPAGGCCALVPMNLGWAYTREQPVDYVGSYRAARMPDGTLACAHSNYRPFRGGWCKPIW